MVDNIIYHKTKPSLNKPFSNRVIKELVSNNALKYLCYSHEVCAIAFINADENDEESLESFARAMTFMESISRRDRFKEIGYGWVNSTCQDNFTKKFNLIPERGGMILYEKNKDVFSRYSFPQDDLRLNNFCEVIFSDKSVEHKIDPDDFILEDNQCSDKKIITEEEKEILNKLAKEEGEKYKRNFNPSMKTDL